jgi:ABC-2 type transport system permease protein
MLLRIARKEWLDMIRDGRFRAASLLVAVLLLASLALGVVHQKTLHTERAAAQRVSRAQWVAQADKDPHQATHHGLYIVKPPSALTLFDPGVNAYTGTAILLESHKQSEATLRSARDQGLAGRFGQLAASSILQLLLPLLIILLGFSAFAGEREAGTLRQILSLGVSRRDLAWGKTLGIIGALAVLLVPATTLAVLALLLSSTNLSTHTSRVALLVASYGLYFGIFIAIALAVSARTQTARAALVGLLGFWVFSSLFLPRLASDAARALHPTPSSLEFSQIVDAAKKAESDKQPPRVRIKALQARLMKQYNVTKLSDLPINFRGVMLQEAEEETNRAFDRAYEKLWGTFEKQNAVYERVALAAPLLGIRQLSMALAGTDWQAHKSFAQSVETYRRDWVRRLNNDLAQHPPRAGEYKAGRDVWESIPPFEYSTVSTGEVLQQQKTNTAILVLWFVAAFGAMLWSTARMRVS